MTAGPRVLIGDRSMAVRAVLRRLLESAPGIEVVAEVDDGEEIVRRAEETSPSVVVLDLDLPSLGGRELIERLRSSVRSPIFVLTPGQRSENARLAMSLSNDGVAAVYPKPEDPGKWDDLGDVLAEAIQQLGGQTTSGDDPPTDVDATPVTGGDVRYVAVGASTGGPGAVHEMLSAVGSRPNFGVAVVQHISPGFEGALTEWLASELGWDVAIARDGEHLRRGTVRFAPPGHHLAIDRSGSLNLDRAVAPVSGHRPSVEVLFRSLLEQPSSHVAAVLLSGMGSDGAEAMAELKLANVLTVAQNEASCAVYGMPRAAIARRAASFSLPPTRIGELLVRASGETP